MIGQYFYIAEYDWGVTVYYNVTKYDIDFCLRQLRKLTTQSKYQNECKQTLYTNKKDRAYVYSSYRRLESVMFIGIPSSTGEFMSTITHEANHIKTHIATYYDLDEKDEEVCYIIGDIVKDMSDTFMQLICSNVLNI